MKSQNTKTGFTLIELSAVVLIISVLIGTIIVANSLSNNAKIATARTLTYSSPVKDIDGLIVWYETTMPQSITNLEAENGKSISTWYDLSSNRKNASIIAAYQPTYTAVAINGLPAVSFDGVNDNMTWEITNKASNNFSIFVVAKNKSGQTHEIDTQSTSGVVGLSGQKYLFFPSQEGSINAGSGISMGTNGISVYEHGEYYMPAIAVYNDSTINKIGANSIIISWIVTAKQHKIYLNGLLAVNGLTSPRTNVYSPIRIGGTASSFGGDIGEIIIFNRVLSDQEQKDVEQYLSNKYAISVS